MTAQTLPTIDWNEYAICYDTLLSLTPYQELLNQALTQLDPQPADRVLDFCCGTGNLLRRVAENYPVAHITGSDFSEHMLNLAHSKCTQCHTSLFSVDANQALPWTDNNFTKIACINALYTFADPAFTLRELHRILTPGGTIVIATPRHDYDSGLILKAQAESDEPDSAWRNPHQSLDRELQLIKRAVSNNETAERMVYIARHNRLIIADRTFHFLSPRALVQLLQSAGFIVRDLTSTYADQNTLVTATKE